MTAAKRPAAPKAEPRVELVEAGGLLRAVWRESVVRFLLSDGSTVDVLTARDDSELRGVLLKHLGVEAIAGSVHLGPPE